MASLELWGGGGVGRVGEDPLRRGQGQGRIQSRDGAPEGQCAGPGTLGPPWLAAGVGEGLPGDGLSLEQRPKGH